MKVITDSTKVPNAGAHGVGFVYLDPDSGVYFVRARPEQVADAAFKHRTANNYSINPNFSQFVIDNICKNTPGGICSDESEPTLTQRAVSMTKALAQSAKSGFATCTDSEVAERLHICGTSGLGGAHCEHYRGMNGFFGVLCGKCGCTKLKLHIKTSQCPKNLWPAL